MAKLDIGKFDREIVINTLTTTPNNSGGRSVSTITATRTIWANVKQLTPANMLLQGQDANSQGYEFTVRREIDLNITRQNTITFEGVTLNIIGVYEQNLNRFIVKILAYKKN